MPYQVALTIDAPVRAEAVADLKREVLVRHLETWAPAALHRARRATYVHGYADADGGAVEPERLDEDGDEHGRRVEAERAKCGDFARPRRDRCVHRQDGAEDGADTHKDCDTESDRLDESGHGDRLGGVVEEWLLNGWSPRAARFDRLPAHGREPGRPSRHHAWEWQRPRPTRCLDALSGCQKRWAIRATRASPQFGRDQLARARS